MKYVSRIGLFVLTNIAILAVLIIIWQVFGLEQRLAGEGVELQLGALLAFCAVFGFGGAFISLAISKWTAKMSTGAQVISDPRTAAEQWLVETVAHQARAAGIGMPEVAVWDSPEVNAFATGMSKNKALVAVSTGLLQQMSREEAEGP